MCKIDRVIALPEFDSRCSNLALQSCEDPCGNTNEGSKQTAAVLVHMKLPEWLEADCLMHAVAHVKSGAVTGLEAGLALQRGREEAQRLLKLASTALQQHQQLPRSASFPPKGRQSPIGPNTHNAQVSACCCHAAFAWGATQALQLSCCQTCRRALRRLCMLRSTNTPPAAQQTRLHP